jgi:hypothetical protein
MEFGYLFANFSVRLITNGKKKKMFGRTLYGLWIVALAFLILLLGGCNGVLYEKQQADGQTNRLILNKDNGWDSYDITPRYYSQNPKDTSDFGLVLKNEHTF